MHYVTPGYAAILALVLFALSVRTLRLRRRLGIAIGDGADEQMLRAVRVHANFIEYVPITLLLALMVELSGGPAAIVHALCFSLLIGRLSHAFGVRRSPEDYRYRVFGMALTFTALVGGAIALLALQVLGRLG